MSDKKINSNKCIPIKEFGTCIVSSEFRIQIPFEFQSHSNMEAVFSVVHSIALFQSAG